MQKIKLEFIMALKKGVVEMKKIIFIIAGIVAMTFLVIWGFETKQMQIESIEENYEEMEVITENVKDFAEVELEEKQVDEEYERLLKEVEYATYDECLKAGFEIAFSDTVNILGFDPIEVIYKGKVIGYKLKINYTNPMEN